MNRALMTRIMIAIVLIVLPKLFFGQCNDEFFPQEVVADTTYFIKGKNFKGYIFPANYHGYILDNDVKTFLLNPNQVGEIERIFTEQHNSLMRSDHRVSRELKLRKNVAKQYRKFDRQYLGFINSYGEESAIIVFANRSGKGKKYFVCFERIMVQGFGDFFEKNQSIFIVNFEKDKLILP